MAVEIHYGIEIMPYTNKQIAKLDNIRCSGAKTTMQLQRSTSYYTRGKASLFLYLLGASLIFNYFPVSPPTKFWNRNFRRLSRPEIRMKFVYG